MKKRDINKKLKKLSKQYHNVFYPGWRVFETELPPHGRNVSWEAFVKYVAANKGDKKMEHHWKSQFHQCRICNNDYQYITHLENISNEAEYIFQQLKIGEDLISTTIKIVFNRHYFLFISGTLGEITSFAGNFDYNFS